MNEVKVAVTSRSFSKHAELKAALLSRYPNTRFNEQGQTLAGDSLIQFLSGCQKVIAGLETFDARVLDALPELNVISRFGVGLDGLDLSAMSQRGIRLGWSPDVNSLSVAELTLGLMLALLRNTFLAAMQLKAGVWKKREGCQLTGKTIGIIGAGHVGQALIKLLTPFECSILINDVVPRRFAQSNVQSVDRDTLITTADIITLHVPATPATIGMINTEVLQRMKAGAYLINTARGALVDQGALKQALKEGRIAGAALDVYQQEPPTDAEFLALPNLICTPHIAGNSQEAELAMGRAAITGLDDARLPEAIFKQVG